MVDIIEEAKRELGSGVVAYTEFVLDFKKDADYIYCFFEGKEDRSYYSFRIKMIHQCDGHGYFDYVCNGKESLKKLYDLVHNHTIYSESNIGYFVDSDFDGIIFPSDIYTTPFYSVENFYVVDSALENILVNEFNISRQCPCFQQTFNIFNKLKSEFHDKIITLNTWLACQSDYRKQNSISTRLNIENSLNKVMGTDDFNKIVNPDMSGLNFPDELQKHEEIEKIFSNSPKIEKPIFQAKYNQFITYKGEERFRGKFELKFLVSFLNRFKDEIGKRKNSIFPKRYNTSLRFEYVTSLSQLTNNAFTPACLIQYIKNIKNVA